MTKTKRVSKAAAAKAEKDTAERTIAWQGLTLTLPPMLPESITLRLVQIEDAAAEKNPAPTWKLLTSIVGADQFDSIIRILERNEGVDIGDVVKLLSDIFAQYGTSEGESEASQGS